MCVSVCAILVQDDITCQISSKSFIRILSTPHKNAHQTNTPNEVTRQGDKGDKKQ